MKKHRWYFRPFRRLRWKLTLSYTAVTVAVMICLEALFFLVGWGMLTVSSAFPAQIARVLDTYFAPEVRPYIEASPPDREGLEGWLETVTTQGIEVGEGQRISLSTFSGGSGLIAVVDSEGRLLAALPSDDGAVGEPFQAEGADVLRAALGGESDPSHQFVRLPDRRLVFAVPIRSEDGREILGALYVSTQPTMPGLAEYARSVLGLLGWSAIVFAVGVGIVGTLFGSIVARGVARRLSRLARAADAWGRGDFSVVVEDDSPDEIGELVRHLNRMARQLQNFVRTRQQLAAMEERNRLARDLHDAVKQQVFAATMNLGAAQALWDRDPMAARRKVDEALALAQQAQRELNALVWELRPADLQGRGLAAALQEYVDGWSQQVGIRAECAVHGERALSPEIEEAFFRVAQEALANVARHSRASRVWVRLDYDDGVTLTVSDDGDGFDPTAAKGAGLGLRSMEERMAEVGGSLEVESHPGRGTQVRAVWKKAEEV
ncbi:MAG TPA: HAMP domain-containing protein [Chloroflexi bacterium]|nr:HAMP domain-containing protein [Chloroflexota bacterium]